MRITCTVLMLAALAAPPALADIVDVSINGSLFLNGTLSFLGPGCPNVLQSSFFVTGTNSQTGLGTYSLDRSDALNCPPPDTFVKTSARADQTATISKNSIVLTNSASVDTLGFNGVAAPIAGASSMFTIDFELTQPYSVDLTDSINTSCGEGLFGRCGGGAVFDGSAGGSIMLTGPGGNIPLLPMLTLDPGKYVLTVSGSASGSTDTFLDASSLEKLDAEFAPVPEPRSLAIFAAALLAAFGPFVKRARIGRSHS